MITYKKRYLNLFFVLILIIIFSLVIFTIINKFQKEKDKAKALEPITINLLTSVHPNLPWNFSAIKPKIIVIPGEVITVEYLVENLSGNDTTGIATFAYFPSQFGNYISKINCFCYDAQTLKLKQKSNYTLVLFIDPEVTKDNKTKDIKEVTIQFTFFDYKEYKKAKANND